MAKKAVATLHEGSKRRNVLIQKVIKNGEVSKDKFIEILETEQLSTKDSIISSVENVLSLSIS